MEKITIVSQPKVFKLLDTAEIGPMRCHVLGINMDGHGDFALSFKEGSEIYTVCTLAGDVNHAAFGCMSDMPAALTSKLDTKLRDNRLRVEFIADDMRVRMYVHLDVMEVQVSATRVTK